MQASRGRRGRLWTRRLERAVSVVRILIALAITGTASGAILYGHADAATIAALTVALTALPRQDKALRAEVVAVALRCVESLWLSKRQSGGKTPGGRCSEVCRRSDWLRQNLPSRRGGASSYGH